MILRQIRLKNIKSYGEGLDKNGVTISFEEGVNRIAGKNGAGKTTLIESIGYVLFAGEPIHEENFQVDTYFLQAGKKAGEIELMFEIDGEAYRIHRGIGPANKIRQKLIRVADGSCDAEGDHEVGDALCKLFKVTGRDRLAELFMKLIGIKQGCLPLPFDSKAKAARDHFEPLMDVAIFRECNEKLKPVVDKIKAITVSLKTEFASLAQQIRDREDSPQKKAEAEEAVKTVTAELNSAKEARAAAESTKKQLETNEAIFVAAEKSKTARIAEVDLAAGRYNNAEKSAKEAGAAVQIIAEVGAGFNAYVQADQLLTKLQERQTQRLKLQRTHGELDSQRSSTEEQAKLMLERAESENKEASEKQRELISFQVEDKIARDTFLASQPEHDRLTQKLRTAEAHQKSVDGWITEVAHASTRVSSQSQALVDNWSQISRWDRNQLKNIQAEMEAASAMKQRLGEELAAAVQYKKTLVEQLTQISGGTCPFLRAKCKQFEPDQVRGDITSHEAKITSLKKQVAEATTAHATVAQKTKFLGEAEAKINALAGELAKSLTSLLSDSEPCFSTEIKANLDALTSQFPSLASRLRLPSLSRITISELFSSETQELYPTILTTCRDSVQVFARAVKPFSQLIATEVASEQTRIAGLSDERARARERLNTNQKTVERFQKEIADLTKKASVDKDKGTSAAMSATSLKTRVAEVDASLQTFANLDQELASALKIKSDNAGAHGKYLGAKPTADTLEQRKSALEVEKRAVANTKAALELATAVLATAQASFDKIALETAKSQFQEAAERTSRLIERKQFLDAELKKQQKRYDEFTRVQAKAQEIERELGRLEAAEELTETARSLLPKAAPAVAQSICNRITARAQQTFNLLNHDPAELSWSSDNYSLRINTAAMNAGRFAMLSGGEQTKLALSMVLSMIHEFISCGFCIFDEPTYGIDIDSKQKLADSIIQMQQACKLQQLLLVSHDNAFDGKVEHVLTIAKAGLGGSQAVFFA
jgi:exonuclease SbcC